ncbi:MAG: hypothetical protein IH939_18590, partial [Acidobacteria bacterium]|nr:hypothetical protein [Acidobacteriota bacterium]
MAVSDGDPEAADRVALELARDVWDHRHAFDVPTLTPETVDVLTALRREAPTAGFVLLSFSYEARAVNGLREFSKHSVAGCAYLLKHTV